jgi:hypothetical protein
VDRRSDAAVAADDAAFGPGRFAGACDAMLKIPEKRVAFLSYNGGTQLQMLSAARSPLLTIGTLAARGFATFACLQETRSKQGDALTDCPLGYRCVHFPRALETRRAGGLTIVHPSSFEVVDRIHTEHGGHGALANCAEVAVAVFRRTTASGAQTTVKVINVYAQGPSNDRLHQQAAIIDQLAPYCAGPDTVLFGGDLNASFGAVPSTAGGPRNPVRHARAFAGPEPRTRRAQDWSEVLDTLGLVPLIPATATHFSTKLDNTTTETVIDVVAVKAGKIQNMGFAGCATLAPVSLRKNGHAMMLTTIPVTPQPAPRPPPLENPKIRFHKLYAESLIESASVFDGKATLGWLIDALRSNHARTLIAALIGAQPLADDDPALPPLVAIASSALTNALRAGGQERFGTYKLPRRPGQKVGQGQRYTPVPWWDRGLGDLLDARTMFQQRANAARAAARSGAPEAPTPREVELAQADAEAASTSYKNGFAAAHSAWVVSNMHAEALRTPDGRANAEAYSGSFRTYRKVKGSRQGPMGLPANQVIRPSALSKTKGHAALVETLGTAPPDTPAIRALAEKIVTEGLKTAHAEEFNPLPRGAEPCSAITSAECCAALRLTKRGTASGSDALPPDVFSAIFDATPAAGQAAGVRQDQDQAQVQGQDQGQVQHQQQQLRPAPVADPVPTEWARLITLAQTPVANAAELSVEAIAYAEACAWADGIEALDLDAPLPADSQLPPDTVHGLWRYLVTSVLNLLARCHTWPEEMGKAVVTFIPKAGRTAHRDTGKDYRPISVLPTFARLLSRILINRTRTISVDVGAAPMFLSPEQFGFRTGYGALHAGAVLQTLLDARRKAGSRQTFVLQTDLSQAFDSVPWSMILAGLRARNASQAFLTWVESWLGRRSYHVGTLAADVVHPRRGVPQGDPMSPWLFAIAIDYGLAAVQPYGVSLARPLAPAPTEAEFAANPVQFDPGDPRRRTGAVGFADDINLIGGSRISLILMFQILSSFFNISGMIFHPGKMLLMRDGKIGAPDNPEDAPIHVHNPDGTITAIPEAARIRVLGVPMDAGRRRAACMARATRVDRGSGVRFFPAVCRVPRQLPPDPGTRRLMSSSRGWSTFHALLMTESVRTPIQYYGTALGRVNFGAFRAALSATVRAVLRAPRHLCRTVLGPNGRRSWQLEALGLVCPEAEVLTRMLQLLAQLLTASNPILGLVARWSFLGNDGYPSLPAPGPGDRMAPNELLGLQPVAGQRALRSSAHPAQGDRQWPLGPGTANLPWAQEIQGLLACVLTPRARQELWHSFTTSVGIPQNTAADREMARALYVPFRVLVGRTLRQPHSSAHWIVTRSNADALGALVFAHEQGTYREVHGSAPRPCPLCRWAVPAGEAPPPESTPHWILDCPGPRVDGIPSLGRGQGHAAVGNGARPPAPPLALGGPGAAPTAPPAPLALTGPGGPASRTRARRAALAVAGGSGLPLGDNNAGPAAPGGPAPPCPAHPGLFDRWRAAAGWVARTCRPAAPGSGRLVPPTDGQASLFDGRFGHFVEEAGMAPSRCRPFANTEPSPAEAAVLTRAVTLCTRIYRYSFPRAIQAYRRDTTPPAPPTPQLPDNGLPPLAGPAASTRSRTRAIAIHNGGPARGTRAAIALRAAQPA